MGFVSTTLSQLAVLRVWVNRFSYLVGGLGGILVVFVLFWGEER